MNIPQILLDSGSDDVDVELSTLEKILQKAKSEYGIEGILHGGIKSQFQKQAFEKICNKLNLKSISPLWEGDPAKYMNDLISSNFDFIITSVSSNGLDDFWLGKTITASDIESLALLSEEKQKLSLLTVLFFHIL